MGMDPGLDPIALQKKKKKFNTIFQAWIFYLSMIQWQGLKIDDDIAFHW